jgi:hypothetical protein
MKKILLLLSIILVSCSNDDNIQQPQPTNQNTIVGRWNVVGQEGRVMYEFTATKRYTFYSTDGTFGDLSTAIPKSNPWVYEGKNIVINMFFGHLSVLVPTFKCNGNVVDLVLEQGSITLFREGYNIKNCNE